MAGSSSGGAAGATRLRFELPGALGAKPGRTLHLSMAGESVQVVCTHNNTLAGLFVVWTLAEPPPATGGDGPPPTDDQLVLRVGVDSVEAHSDPGAGRYLVGIVDRAGYLQPVSEQVRLVPRDPAARRERIMGAFNPWNEIARERLPHAFKFVEGAKYRGYLVRHIDVRWALDLAAKLDAGEEQDKLQDLDFTRVNGQLTLKCKDDSAAYVPAGHKLYEGWTLYAGMPHGGCPLVVKMVGRLQHHLAALRFPIGSEAHAFEVQTYHPPGRAPVPTYQLEGRTAACITRFQQHVRERKAWQVPESVKSQAHHAVVQKASPFEPQPSANTAWQSSHAFLIGGPVDLPECADPLVLGFVNQATAREVERWITNGYRKPGPIMLPVLMETNVGNQDQHIWLREEAAVQLEAWRVLARAFGVAYGMPTWVSWRDVLAIERGTVGKINNSIHKSGLAIDFLIDADYLKAHPWWPVRFEIEWILDVRTKKKIQDLEDKLAAATQKEEDTVQGSVERPLVQEPLPMREVDAEGEVKRTLSVRNDSKGKAWVGASRDYRMALLRYIAFLRANAGREQARRDDMRVRWKLYGHSSLPVFGASMQAAQTLATNLRRLRGSGWPAPGTTVSPAQRGSLRDALWRWFERVGLGAEGGERIERTIGSSLLADYRYFVDTVIDLCEHGRFQAVKDALFRETIRPFICNPREDAGGHDHHKEVRADADDYTLPPAPGRAGGNHLWRGDPPASFVYLTALARFCGMYSITAYRAGQWKLGWAELVVRERVRGEDRLVFSDLARFLQEAQESLASGTTTSANPDMSKDPVQVFRRGQEIARIDGDTIDAQFAVDWAKELERWKRSHPLVSVEPAQVTLEFAEDAKLTKGVKVVVGALRNTFADRHFVIWSAGEEAGDDLRSQQLQPFTGADLATLIDEAILRFQEAIPKDRREARRRDRSSCRLTIQPVLDSRSMQAVCETDFLFLPGDKIVLRAPGAAKSLEWWHFQSDRAFKVPWGNEISAIGYAPEVLSAPFDAVERLDGPAEYVGYGVGYTLGECADPNPGTTLDQILGYVEVANIKGAPR